MVLDIEQHSGLPFPKSLPEFQRLFPNDAACATYLEKIRWENGFTCEHCGDIGEPFRFAAKPHVLRCRSCRRDIAFVYTLIVHISFFGKDVPVYNSTYLDKGECWTAAKGLVDKLDAPADQKVSAECRDTWLFTKKQNP